MKINVDLVPITADILPAIPDSKLSTTVRYPEIFSTTERRVGTWTDGKALYQKTIILPNGTGDTDLHQYSLSTYGISKVSTIFTTDPTYYTLGNATYAFQYNDGSAFECNVSPTKLNITIGYLPIAKSKIVVTVRYTKTS